MIEAMITLGAIAASNAQAEANANAQYKQARYNQIAANQEAARIEVENQENARRQREESEYLKANQRAQLGKSGAAMNSGSPLAILGATAKNEEIKALDMHRQGYTQAAQQREQAKMYGYQGAVAKASAPSGFAKTMSMLNGLVSLETGAANTIMSAASFGSSLK